MKQRLKNIQPPATPRLSMTITFTIVAGVCTALVTLVSILASTTMPDILKPYVPYSWSVLLVLSLLGIGVAVWQNWYASGQTANNAPAPTPASQPSVSPVPGSHFAPTPATLPTVSPPGSAHYHTCVLSYANKDVQFVKKLYTDLKAQGVPCLLVDQDIKIGEKLREETSRAVRQLDKLLLVLSQHAIDSTWVEEAVDIALDRERQNPGTHLLFPLRLDDTVLDTEKYWAIAVRQRLIGDFRQWNQDTEYQQALQRVLKDLRV